MKAPIKLNLGCGSDYRKGYVNVDRVCNFHVRPDRIVDLAQPSWPFKNWCANEILMNHVLEHLPDTLGTFSEIDRILIPGGIFHGEVPFCFSETAFIEPDHVRYFHPRSFHRLAELYRFRPTRIKLACLAANRSYRLKRLLPFKPILRHFFLNIYDVIQFTLVKL